MLCKNLQNQSSVGVRQNRRSVKIQQIYRRTPMRKYDFSKVWKELQFTITKKKIFKSV